MRIAYLSVDDPKDYLSWSGLKLNIYKTLKSLNHKVKIIGPLKNLNRFPYVIKRESFKLFNFKYDSERKISLSKKYSKSIKFKLKKQKIDLIFTSDTYLVSYLDTNIPIVLWLDATYRTYYEHYFKDKKIHKKSFKEANYLEKLALDKSKKIILTSKWAKKDAVNKYKINPNKIFILPFGSNLKESRAIKLKKININKKIKLISIGVDWERKGMDKTIEITKYLNKKGVKTDLNIIGCKNLKKSLPHYVKQFGFLDKNNYVENLKIRRLLSSSDFHILMTKNEACGVVFAEANSFGLFNITNDVGGVRGMIKNNYNGKLFEITDSHKKIGDFIIKTLNNNKKCMRIKKQSLSYYFNKLSWKSNSSVLQKLLLESIQ